MTLPNTEAAGAQNDMTAKAFPGLKTKSYDPKAYAKSLAQVRKEEDEEEDPELTEMPKLHQLHRHQTRAFDDVDEDDPATPSKKEKPSTDEHLRAHHYTGGPQGHPSEKIHTPHYVIEEEEQFPGHDGVAAPPRHKRHVSKPTHKQAEKTKPKPMPKPQTGPPKAVKPPAEVTRIDRTARRAKLPKAKESERDAHASTAPGHAMMISEHPSLTFNFDKIAVERERKHADFKMKQAAEERKFMEEHGVTEEVLK